MINFGWTEYTARQDFLADCERIYKHSLPSECQKCGASCPCEERAGRVLKSVIEDSERMANALRRINDSLAMFDRPVYDSARAYAGQVLLMRQAVEKALNPNRDAAEPPEDSPEEVRDGKG